MLEPSRTTTRQSAAGACSRTPRPAVFVSNVKLIALKTTEFFRSRALIAYALTAFVFISACARPPDLIGVDNPNFPVSEVDQATQHTVFVATTRQPSKTEGVLFSEDRAASLGFASVQVSIPPTHVAGQLERAKRLPPDPRTEFAVVNPIVFDNDQGFVAALDREISKRPKGQRDILFFVHGYNNSTSDSILRLAQFVEDSGYTGIPVLFDWASAAKATKYVYDLNSALVARPQLEQVGRVLGQSKAEGYDIFAHSMGAFLTMEAFVVQSIKGNVNRSGKLQHVVLASPDIDFDLFRTQIQQVTLEPEGFFVLLSEDDRALRLSRRIAGGVPRVGAIHAESLSALGVTVIDLSQIDDSSSGSHSKFAGSPEVVQLLGNGLNRNGHFGSIDRSTGLDAILADIPISVYFD